MLRYILRRILYAIITLFIISTLTFILMKTVPGNPFNDPKIKPEVRRALEQRYGLNKPLPQQYAIYMRNLLKGDLGVSLKQQGRRVNNIITENFPKSFALGWRAMLIAVVFGISLGVIAALNHEKVFDYFTMFISILGISIPNIVLGPLLAYTLGVKLRWVPVTVISGNEWSMILPSITLALGSIAFISRLMRSTTLEVLNQDYINTAKSKGLSQKNIVWRHVLRNAIMPVITVLGPLFAALITGSIVIEQIFAVAGLGKYFVNSIMSDDYPVIMGITIFYAILIIVSILLVDLAYGFIDPRLRISGKGAKSDA